MIITILYDIDHSIYIINTLTALCLHLDAHHSGFSRYNNRLGSQSANISNLFSVSTNFFMEYYN